jgi:hypothetical protein
MSVSPQKEAGLSFKSELSLVAPSLEALIVLVWGCVQAQGSAGRGTMGPDKLIMGSSLQQKSRVIGKR